MAQWRWRLLVDAVTVLAADAAAQVRWVGDAHVDELGLEFGNAFSVVSTLQRVDGVDFTAEVLAALGRIDATLTSMSGDAAPWLWTTDALIRSERWADLRDQARAVLSVLPPCPTASPASPASPASGRATKPPPEEWRHCGAE